MGGRMIEDIVNGPYLWFLNRSSGIVLLGLLAVVTLFGVVASHSRARGRVPSFVSQQVHRNLSLLAVILLVVHVSSAVIDTYVDIRWWHALVPFGATYKRVWMAAGAVALDLIAVVVLTSLIRTRMPAGAWRMVHLTSYAAFGLGAAHGLGIGTDAEPYDSWGFQVTAACVALVGLALIWRLVRIRRGRLDDEQSLV
ncbi:MAG: ferric reductase-like transmembrane domain-containing protein [Nocardioides sp.]